MQRSKAKVLTLIFFLLSYIPLAIFLTFIDKDFKSQKPHFMDLSFLNAKTSSTLLQPPFQREKRASD